MPVPVKVDEDLPAEIADLVAAAGHDARTVHAQGHSGMPDERLWSVIQQEQRILLTADKGFADARIYPPGSHSGIVLFRLPHESRSGYVRLAEQLLARLSLDDIVGAIAVVSPGTIRVLRK